MAANYCYALCPMFGLGIDVLAQACTSRLFGVGRSIAFGGAAGLVATAIFTRWTAPPQDLADAVATWLVELITFLMLAFNFWMFLNLNITSLRIRILRELSSEGSGLTLSALRERYSSDEILGRRLARLERSKQMVRIDDRWHLRSPTLVLLVAIMECLRFMALPERARCERSGAHV